MSRHRAPERFGFAQACCRWFRVRDSHRNAPLLICRIVRRHLSTISRLIRAPCPVAVETLPRAPGGFSCARCGHTVVDVASLSLEEAVEHRRRVASSDQRICSAYTVDREERVLLREAPGSSVVVAVALGVLLAACEPSKDVTASAVVSVSADSLEGAPSDTTTSRATPVAFMPLNGLPVAERETSAAAGAAPQRRPAPQCGEKKVSSKASEISMLAGL